MSDFRHWLARKLLNLVNRIDPECRIMCDAQRKWYFRRGWEQPIHGADKSTP